MTPVGSRIVVPVLAAMALIGIARAQPGGAPTPVDATRQNEHYAIPPGAEPLFSAMLGSGQTLPGGCTLSSGQIEYTSVRATYTCGGGQVVLELVHPDVARPGGVRTQRFAVTVKSGTPPDGLVETIAERIRARETGFEWQRVGDSAPQKRRWGVPVAAGGVATLGDQHPAVGPTGAGWLAGRDSGEHGGLRGDGRAAPRRGVRSP